MGNVCQLELKIVTETPDKTSYEIMYGRVGRKRLKVWLPNKIAYSITADLQMLIIAGKKKCMTPDLNQTKKP